MLAMKDARANRYHRSKTDSETLEPRGWRACTKAMIHDS